MVDLTSGFLFAESFDEIGKGASFGAYDSRARHAIHHYYDFAARARAGRDKQNSRDLLRYVITCMACVYTRWEEARSNAFERQRVFGPNMCAINKCGER